METVKRTLRTGELARSFANTLWSRFFPATYGELVCKPTLFGCESDIEFSC